MKQYFKALALTMALAAASTATAQAAAPDACEQLTDRIEFCGETGGWSRLSRAVAEATAVYKRGDNTIGKLIVELTGTKALRDKDVQSAILKKVSGQIRKLGGTLDVIALKGGMMNRPAGTILYSYESRGTEVLFLHSYMVQKGMVMQFITVAPGVTDDAVARATHRTFLSGFTFSDPGVSL
ncbi:MAG: hypothetical protein RID23_00135 [Roseovarius sp.]